MMTRPEIRRMAPNSHGHMGLALNSVNSSRMYAPRTATVVGTIVKNGPSARANMRVRICDCSGVLIALPPFVGECIDHRSVYKTDGRYSRAGRATACTTGAKTAGSVGGRAPPGPDGVGQCPE